jgi:S-sulfosulfanyl-L-cysteine sulfohydrolase
MSSSEKEQESSRRKFLKTGSVLGLASLLSPVELISSPDKTHPGKSSSNPTHDAGKKITILYTSDIHGQLFTHDEFFWENGSAVYKKRGGLSHLKTMIEQFRQADPANTLLIDGGDYFHGSGVASLTNGEALIPIFNYLNYDLMLPGNWEVVYKKRQMLFDMGHTTAAKICANMWHNTKDEENGELIFPPYWIKNFSGLKIGFIGYTDHLIPLRQSPAYSKGISFRHADYNVARYVRMLKETEGCQLVFLVTHMGLAQQVALSNNPDVKGVDLILGADTHERVREPLEGNFTKVVECGAFGSFLGKIEIGIENGKPGSIHYELLDVDPEKYKADKGMEALIEEAYSPLKKELQTILGYSTTSLVRYFVLETPMDNFITDALMWKLKPDIAVSNGFRFCQPLHIDPQTGRVAITKEFLWNMLPVDNETRRGMITGQQLKDWLEKELENAFAKNFKKRFGGWFVRYSGMQVNFTIGNDFGKRVNWIKVANQPLDLKREYSIIACEREGDPKDMLCRFEKVKNPEMTGLFLHQVIEEYLTEKGTIAPSISNRAIATDEPSTLLTQLRGTSYEFR